jgi:hypothetical protein
MPARPLVEIRVEGVRRILRKLNAADPPHAGPWTDALHQAADEVYREQQRGMPRASGGLAGSHKKVFQARPVPLWAKITANKSRGGVRYGFVLNWGAAGRKRFHYAGTGKSTKGWFTDPMERLQSKINGLLEAAARKIEDVWNR